MAGPAVLYQTGDHASRPAVDAGCVLYYCTDHSKLYVSDATAWSDFVTIPTGTGVATDPIFDAAGDLAVGSGADTAARLAIGATNGMALRRVSGAVAWDLPPGHEFSYVENTSSVSITATAEASANTIVTAAAVTLDGSTDIMVEYFSPASRPDTAGVDRRLNFWLYDGTSIGRIGLIWTPAAGTAFWPVYARRKLVAPSAGSHTYSIRGTVDAGTGSAGAGAGGTGNSVPQFIRVTKA